jgi:hypothetical protein
MPSSTTQSITTSKSNTIPTKGLEQPTAESQATQDIIGGDKISKIEYIFRKLAKFFSRKNCKSEELRKDFQNRKRLKKISG